MYYARIYNGITGKLITTASGEDPKALDSWCDECESEDTDCYGIVEPSKEEQTYMRNVYGLKWSCRKLEYVSDRRSN